MTRGEQSEQAAKSLAATKRTIEAQAQCEYDFIMGVQWADEHPRWISVEDELPPLHEHMLIAPTQEHIERVGGRAVDVICFMDEEHLAAWLPHITHWMSFPAPPVKI